MSNKLLIGCTHQATRDRLLNYLRDMSLVIFTPDDFGIVQENVPRGKSSAENAAIQAKLHLRATKTPTISMDVCLRIEESPGGTKQASKVSRLIKENGIYLDSRINKKIYELLSQMGRDTMFHWKLSLAIADQRRGMLIRTYSLDTLLGVRPGHNQIKGEQLSSMMVDPITGGCYADMQWEDRPDVRIVRQFVERWFSLAIPDWRLEKQIYRFGRVK